MKPSIAWSNYRNLPKGCRIGGSHGYHEGKGSLQRVSIYGNGGTPACRG
jgi:hypothetical protein